MNHIKERLKSRGLIIDQKIIKHLAARCGGDTALIIHRFDKIINESDKDYREREESNGDLLILIVRHNFPVTIMYRRSSQNNCINQLRVKTVCDVSGIFQNKIVKEK